MFFGAGAGLSRDFLGRAGADIFYLKQEKKIWSRSWGKMAQLRNTDLNVISVSYSYLRASMDAA